jgi:hypothetical protein
MIVCNYADHGHHIAKTAGCVFNPASDTCISSWKAGRLLGGVIYQNYTGESIAMHTAGYAPNWLTRELLWVFFDYPFNQLGVKRIFAQVPEANARALAFDLKVGFQKVTFIEGVFPDGGVTVIKMERADCRWLHHKPKLLEASLESDNGWQEQTAETAEL